MLQTTTLRPGMARLESSAGRGSTTCLPTGEAVRKFQDDHRYDRLEMCVGPSLRKRYTRRVWGLIVERCDASDNTWRCVTWYDNTKRKWLGPDDPAFDDLRFT